MKERCFNADINYFVWWACFMLASLILHAANTLEVSFSN